jgi:hypothetical protein
MSKFQVPESTLKQLGEFSGGGFILFIYDQNGAPKVYADFDTPAHGLGMQKFMQNWLSLIDTINLETSMDEINNPEDGPESEEKS